MADGVLRRGLPASLLACGAECFVRRSHAPSTMLRMVPLPRSAGAEPLYHLQRDGPVPPPRSGGGGERSAPEGVGGNGLFDAEANSVQPPCPHAPSPVPRGRNHYTTLICTVFVR